MKYFLMNLQDSLFVWYNLSIVAFFIMGLFLWKYYSLFEFRDKLILAYLGQLVGIAMFIFLCFDYPGSNSFFLAAYPFFLIQGVYRLIRLHQNKGEELNQFRDKLVRKSLNLLALIGVMIYFYFNDRNDNMIMIIICCCILIAGIYDLKKFFRSKEVVKS
jgi:hypothetical protein